MCSGIAKLNVLSDDEVDEIYQASLKILEETGVAFQQEDALTLFHKNGAEVDFDKNIVKFPSSLVEDLIKKVPKEYTLYHRDSEKRIDIAEGTVHFQIGDYAGYILDYRTGERRRATLKDLQDVIRVDDALDCFDLFEPPVMPLDVSSSMTQIKVTETMFKNTTKPSLMGLIIEPKEGRYILKMAEAVAGGEEALRKKPLMGILCQPTSPLIYAKEVIEKMNDCMRKGVPLSIIAAPTCGMTAPVTIAGWLTVGIAEVLAATVYVQLIAEKTPVVTGLATNVMNLRDGNLNIASPEAALCSAASIQIVHHLGLLGVAQGGTDSKIPSIQTGYEKALSILYTLLAGAEVYGLATLDDWGTTAMEQHVIDAEIVEAIKRILQGIDVTPETLALDVIKEVGVGGSYLSHKHTFKHFRKEHWIPELSFRESWETLKRKNRKTIVDNAESKVAKILQDHRPEPLDGDVQKELEAITKEAEKELGAS